MKSNLWIKWLQVAIVMVMVSACGGGGGNDVSAADNAITSLRAYASDPANADAPDADDYAALGVDLNGHTVAQINAYIAQLGDPDKVDSKEELDAIAAALGVTILDTDGDGTYDAFDEDDDGDGTSDADEISNGTDPLVNSKPIADAGDAQSLDEGRTITLDASGSRDEDSPTITYLWSFTAKPTGSSAVISDTTVVEPTFLADIPGEYILQLIVNDGNLDSDPSSVSITIRKTLLIARKTIQNGYEPWITNGTKEGTRQLLNINTAPNSSNPDNAVQIGGYIYFTTSSSINGTKIWRTDGTEDGVSLVDHNASYTNSISLANFHDTLYVTYNQKLWKINDTSDGLIKVADVNGDIMTTSVDISGDITYVSIYQGYAGTTIWKVSPTEAIQVQDEDRYYYGGLVLSSGKIYFSHRDSTHGNELRVLDPADDGISLVEDIQAGSGSSDPKDLVDVDGRLYFSLEAVAGETRTLARLNNTRDGIDVSPFGLNPKDLVYFDGALYFSGNDDDNGTELRRYRESDDSLNTFELIPGVASSVVRDLKVVNNNLYFMAKDNSLCMFDISTQEATEIKDVGGTIYNLTAGDDGKLYFHVIAGSFFSDDYNIWSSDSTTDGTILIEEHYTPTASGGMIIINNRPFLLFFNHKIIFPHKDEMHGKELWSSDGTVGAAQLLKDIDDTDQDSIQNSGVLKSVNIGFVHYFVAYEYGIGDGLWRSDGIDTIKLLGDKNTTIYGELTDVNGTLYFVAKDSEHDEELWKSDGTVEGTMLVSDIKTISSRRAKLASATPRRERAVLTTSSSPRDLTSVDGVLYFSAKDDTHGRELWRVNGDNVEMMSDIDGNYGVGLYRSSKTAIVNAGDKLYFAVHNEDNHSMELWQKDGNTIKQWSNFNIIDTQIDNLAAVGDTVFFYADDGTHGSELWKTTATGVEMVEDMVVGAGSSYFSSFISHQGNLFFGAYTVDGDLWSYDGTDLVKVQSHVSINELSSVDDILYFTSHYPEHKGQIWSVQDDTPSILKDLHDLDTPFSIRFYGDISGSFLFGGKASNEFGYTIWSTDGTEANTSALYLYDEL